MVEAIKHTVVVSGETFEECPMCSRVVVSDELRDNHPVVPGACTDCRNGVPAPRDE